MKKNIKCLLLPLFIFLCRSTALHAQNTASYTLEQLQDSALKNNHILAIKQWQIKEKQEKTKEDEIKRYPTPTLNGNYQHVFNLGEITIPKGTLESNPNTDETFKVGKHDNYGAGLSVYQPISEQSKISTLLKVDKTDEILTEKERFKTSLQIKQAVVKLYYGTLILQKQLDEAEAKLALAKSKFTDVENALIAGKTTNADKVGLQANIADEEQNILKINIQIQDYIGDLTNVTGVNAGSLKLAEIEPAIQPVNGLEEYKNVASGSNADLQIANLNKSKALLGIKAARQSNIPDVGLIGGYSYIFGSAIVPSNNPYVGLNLKWNLQDIFSNKKIVKQRQFQLKQSEENILNTQQQVNNDIEKAYRKINQSQTLITVAQKVVSYQKEELKIQENKQAAGLNVKTDLLNTKSFLAKSEADMYAAQMSYLIAVSDLKILTGQ
jgi:outer membrane protein TolC